MRLKSPSKTSRFTKILTLYLLTLAPPFLYAAESASTTVNAEFSITAVAEISGLADIDFGSIHPSSTLPIDKAMEGSVCFYSSTGAVSLTATTDTSIDYDQQRASLLRNNGTETANFAFLVNEKNVFTNAPNALDFTADTNNNPACTGGIGAYPVKARLLSMPQIAGTYQSTVTLTVAPIS